MLEVGGDGGEEDGEQGTAAGFNLRGPHANAAALLFDDAACDPESEAGAFLALGGEEGLEEFCEMLLRDTGAAVADGDGDACGAEWVGP